MTWLTKKMPKMTEQETEMFNILTEFASDKSTLIDVNVDNMNFILYSDTKNTYFKIDSNGVRMSIDGSVLVRRYEDKILTKFKKIAKEELDRRRQRLENIFDESEMEVLKSMRLNCFGISEYSETKTLKQ